jgi:hypothetical protein
MDDQRTEREGGEGIKVPQYSVKRLMAAFLLVSVGLWDFLIGNKLAVNADHTVHITSLISWQAACWAVECAAIGAGVFTPFKREPLGASLGFVAGVVWTILIIADEAMSV